jgi:myo-inositol-1(or 4)-monophosphatase
MIMNYNSLNTQVNELCREVGSFMLSEQDRLSSDHIDTKGLHDYVTYVDRESEKRLIKRLSEILPGSGFLVEEETIENTNEDYTWIIDPLDGTTNFIHQLPTFSISVALMHQDKIVMGTVLDVKADESYYAYGEGAFKNGKMIQVSARTDLGESLLATGFPYNDFGMQGEYVKMLSYLMRNTRGIRRFGSAAIDLVWVASGRFDGFWEYSLKPWDVAAGSYILQQAGGMVSDFRGKDNYLFGKEIICGNPQVYQQLLDVVHKFF